jgi:hypothetical protein
MSDQSGFFADWVLGAARRHALTGNEVDMGRFHQGRDIVPRLQRHFFNGLFGHQRGESEPAIKLNPNVGPFLGHSLNRGR